MDVVSAHIGERAAALVLELDPPDPPWARNEIGIAAGESLDSFTMPYTPYSF